MPVMKAKSGGFKWGKTGKVYKTRKEAEAYGKRTVNLRDEVLDYFYSEKLGFLYDNRRLGNSVFGGNINQPDFRAINAHNIYVYQF